MEDDHQEQGFHPQIADPLDLLRFYCGGLGCDWLIQGEKFLILFIKSNIIKPCHFDEQKGNDAECEEKSYTPGR